MITQETKPVKTWGGFNLTILKVKSKSIRKNWSLYNKTYKPPRLTSYCYPPVELTDTTTYKLQTHGLLLSFRIHGLLLSLAFAKHKHPRLWLWGPTQKFSNTNSPVCDSKTTLKGLDHQYLWWLEKTATSTILDLKTLQGITPVEDMRELFRYKTLDTKEAHSSLSKNPWKPYLRLAYDSFKYWKKRIKIWVSNG